MITGQGYLKQNIIQFFKETNQAFIFYVNFFNFLFIIIGSMLKKSSSNTAGSILWSCIFHILILVGFISISLHLAYLYAEEPATTPQSRYLHQAFQSQPFKSKLNSFHQNKYFFIKTSCKDCVNQLIKYYTLRQNLSLIYKDITETKKYDHDLWSIRTLVRNTLGQQHLQSKVWVFLVSKFVPSAQIEQLKVIEPNSKIFVISQNQVKIKEKDFINFQINDFDLQKILKFAKVPKKTATVYANYFRSHISEMFQTFDQQFQSIQAQLGAFYRPIQKLSNKGLELLSKLCKDEKLPKKTKVDEKVVKQLDEAGVTLLKERLQWKDTRYLLNYMLQKNTNCTQNLQIVSALSQQSIATLQEQHKKLVKVKEQQSDASKEQKKNIKKKKSKKVKEETDQEKQIKKENKKENKKNKKDKKTDPEQKIENKQEVKRQQIKQNQKQQAISQGEQIQTPTQSVEQVNSSNDQPQTTLDQKIQQKEAQNTVVESTQKQNSDTQQDEKQQKKIQETTNPYTQPQQNKTIAQQL